MAGTIDYGTLMHRAMRGLIQEVLQEVAETGLPGQHHFFITFDTMHPDVEMGDWLSDRYPEEMTIVMQHWYENLKVTDEGFSVTLNFGDSPEPLYVPYEAIRTFVDPSVEFGLRFETQELEETDQTPAATESKPKEATSEPAQPVEADVVSLETFRNPKKE